MIGSRAINFCFNFGRYVWNDENDLMIELHRVQKNAQCLISRKVILNAKCSIVRKVGDR